MRRRDVTTTETTGTFIHTIETAAYLQRCSHFVCYPLSPFTFVRSLLARSLSLSLSRKAHRVGWPFWHFPILSIFSVFHHICMYVCICTYYICTLEYCMNAFKWESLIPFIENRFWWMWTNNVDLCVLTASVLIDFSFIQKKGAGNFSVEFFHCSVKTPQFYAVTSQKKSTIKNEFSILIYL